MNFAPPFANEVAGLLEQFVLEGPVDLKQRGLAVPGGPGVYVIASGECISHIGISGGLRGRIRSLAALGTHRGSAEVICAAYCTGEAPQVWWHTTERVSAVVIERALKAASGEPPTPRERFAGCVNGERLRDDLLAAAGPDTWEAGYIDAVFTIGEKLSLLFRPRFDPVWERLGRVPPSPWSGAVHE